MKPKPKSKPSTSAKKSKPEDKNAISKKTVKKAPAKETQKKDVKPAKKAATNAAVKTTARAKDIPQATSQKSKTVKAPTKAEVKVDDKKKAEAGKKVTVKQEDTGGKPGRKKKKTDDDEEANVVIENIEIIPEPALIPKKVSQKDKIKERILAKLREKQESALHKRNYLPTKKKKYTLEYIIKSSPIILWDFVTTSSGLGLWFADEVDDHLDIFTFTWEGNKQQAEVLEYEDLEFIKFRWVDNPYDEYFEFRITSTEITGDTVLLITDFAEQYELRDVQMLWDSQIKNLMLRLGLGN
jgi:hypothetical protein